MEGILCLSNILLMTLLALNQVDDILGIESGRGLYMESLSSGCALDVLCHCSSNTQQSQSCLLHVQRNIIMIINVRIHNNY